MPPAWLGADIFPVDAPDGQINTFDYSSQFITWFNAEDPRADLNGDGAVDFYDLPIYGGLYNSQQYGGGLSDANPLGPMNVIGFAGYHWDEELGLWLSRHRVYDPELGRWIQRDPAGYVDGLSLYLYVGGNPFSLVDPTGLAGNAIWDLANSVKDRISSAANAVVLANRAAVSTGAGGVDVQIAGVDAFEVAMTMSADGWNKAVDAVAGVADLAQGARMLASSDPAQMVDTVVGRVALDMADRGVGTVASEMGQNVVAAASNHVQAVASGDLQAIGDTIFAGGEILMPGMVGLRASQAVSRMSRIAAGACFVVGTPVYLGTGSAVAIDSIHPGTRVVTSDPGSTTGETDWTGWVLLDLVSLDGSVEIRTLRSRAWYEQADWDRDGDVWFKIEELGLADELEVMKISPAAPAIGEGAGRVVLSTIRSFAREVIELRFEGSGEAVTATPNHQFFSADRGDWTEAADLTVGEVVRTREGSARLLSATLLHEPQWVYNLEVDSDHEYFAGTLGLLVHNAGGCAAGPIRPGRAPEFDGGELTESQFLDAAQRYLGEGYAETKPGRFVSENSNGNRVVRYGQHETRNPGNHHAHFESRDKNGIVTENTRVKLNPDE